MFAKLSRLSPVVRLGVIVGFLTLALLSLIARHHFDRVRAVPVVLQVAPVDPQSLFQGDFVTLRYSINLISREILQEKEAEVIAGQAVYVALANQGKIWVDDAASFTPFDLTAADERSEQRIIGKDGLSWAARSLFDGHMPDEERWKDGTFKAGRTYYVRQRQIGPVWQPVRASINPLQAKAGEVVLRGTVERSNSGTPISLSYGIEAFFVPQGQGLWVEDMARRGGERHRVLVRILVAPSGQGYVDNILLDGKDAFPSSGFN